MEIFYAYKVEPGFVHLDEEESAHCCRVLRHRPGDSIDVIDGLGTLYHCTLADASVARIDSSEPHWGAHPYRLTLAVCPTKNIDRYEWMAEKATELGLDALVPVIGQRSERKVLKTARLGRIVLSAAKQSLKGAVPEVLEPLTVLEFVKACAAAPGLKMICYCSDEVRPRAGAMWLLRELRDSARQNPEITVLVGPEGDFSPQEVEAALEAGFVPVHLGSSRLRTETAALTAAEAVYLTFS